MVIHDKQLTSAEHRNRKKHKITLEEKQNRIALIMLEDKRNRIALLNNKRGRTKNNYAHNNN